MEYYSALKKELLPYATPWMNLEDIYAKWNKPDTEGEILRKLHVDLNGTPRDRVEDWLLKVGEMERGWRKGINSQL